MLAYDLTAMARRRNGELNFWVIGNESLKLVKVVLQNFIRLFVLSEL